MFHKKPNEALTLGGGGSLDLADLIGRGGEGSVYAVRGDPKVVAKLYDGGLSSERRAKLEAMIKMNSQALADITAWPHDLVLSRGKPIGFVMPKAERAEEAHILYSPKSRKQKFPEAGYRFVVHAATNIARAFAVVHEQGIVIGDVNERVAMISHDATVRLIDCDSFQVNDGRQQHLCEVGVPLFTPPELQGLSTFRGTDRNQNHDLFGLAVLLFHMLFLGRHPYSGRFRKAGDMPIEEAIKQQRFAYSANTAQTLMDPPPHTPALTSSGRDPAALFERAFAPSRAGTVPTRPTASEWANVLNGVLANLVNCRDNGAHAYIKDHATCPWCAIEATTGREMFTYVEPGGQASVPLDVAPIVAALTRLTQLTVTAAAVDQLKMGLQPSPAARTVTAADVDIARLETAVKARMAAEANLATKDRAVSARAAGVQSCKQAIILHHGLVVRLEELETKLRHPTLATRGWLAVRRALGDGQAPVDREIAQIRSQIAPGVGPLEQKFLSAEAVLADAQQAQRAAQAAVSKALAVESALRARPTIDAAVRARREHEAQLAAARDRDRAAREQGKALHVEFHTRKSEIVKAIGPALALADEIEAMNHRMLRGIQQARTDARDIALAAYLDTFFVAQEDIPKITTNLKAALRSYGIETAADVTPLAVDAVPGFGPVRTAALLSWRADKERQFQFVPDPQDLTQRIQAVRGQSQAERRRKERELLAHRVRIETWLAPLLQRITAAEHAAYAAARELAQRQVDEDYMVAGDPTRKSGGTVRLFKAW